MPTFFKFTRLSDNKIMDLNEIDELICKELNIPVNEHNYSIMFDIITTIGDKMSGDWDEKKFEDMVEIIKPVPDKYIQLIRRFLHEEYKYTSWRSFK